MKPDSLRRFRRVLPLFASVLVVAGCGEPVAQGGAPAVPEVSVLTVAAQPLALTTELAGRTSAYLVSEVRPQVGGILKKRLFEEGRDVEAGQTLYEIDPAAYAAAHSSAKATLAKAQANLKMAGLTAARYKELASIDAVSRQESDQAAAELQQARADVASAQAALDMAKINLGYTEVVAPIPGRVGRSSVTPGALLSADQAKPLATIQQLDPIYVDVTQSSIDLLRLRQALASGAIEASAGASANVKLTLEDGSLYEHTGELQFSDVSVDPGTGMVALRAVFPNPDHRLLPGMYVRATLEEGVRSDAILLPQRGITRNATGDATALVLNADDEVEARVLETSRTVGDQWLVESGIQPGERLIVEGVQKVRPGASASAVPFEAAS